MALDRTSRQDGFRFEMMIVLVIMFFGLAVYTSEFGVVWRYEIETGGF